MNYQMIVVNNYYNNHTIGFVDELAKLYPNSFLALETDNEIESFRQNIGWHKIKRDYIQPYSIHSTDVLYADVVIYGGSLVDQILATRIKQGRLTFLVTERPYKISTTKTTYIKRLVGSYLHFKRYQAPNFFLLAQGGYVKEDMKEFKNFKNKIFKWGYFPLLTQCNSNPKDKLEITWCGRMLDWKHPEDAVSYAKMLIENHIDFHMNIIGSGELYKTINADIQPYLNYITLLESVNNDVMQQILQDSDVVLVSSDRYEGWGVIVNEAMFHHCIVLSNSLVGSSTYLIKNGDNGYVYHNHKEMLDKGLYIAKNINQLDYIKENAFNTIKSEWNYEVAAKRMQQFCEAYFSNNILEFDEGILSRDNWE